MKDNEDLLSANITNKISDKQKVVENIKQRSCCNDKKCTDKCSEEIVNAFRYMDDCYRKPQE